jgi:hypothetical protein
MIDSDKPVSAAGTAIVSAAALAGFLLIFMAAGGFGSGAQVFPRLLAVVGGISAAVLLAQSLLRARTRARAAGGGVAWRDILVSYIGPPIYAALLYLLGFWIASTLCLAGLLVLLGERRPAMVAALTAGTLLAIYLMFEVSFDIHMPRGLLLA